MIFLTYNILYVVLWTHFELQQALKSHFVLIQSPLTRFVEIYPSKGIFGFKMTLAKIVFILNDFLNI